MRAITALLAGVVILAGPAVTSAQASAPGNDHLADAQAIPAMPFTTTVDTAGATLEAGERTCAGAQHTVWYRFTASTSETLTARVDTSSEVTASVAVYSALHPAVVAPATLSHHECRSTDAIADRAARFEAEAGTTYYVQVGTADEGAVVDLVMGAPGAISGRVTEDPSGEPLEVICVYLADVRYTTDSGILLTGEWAITGSDGRYEITDLDPGPVYVFFYPCGDVDYYPEFYDDAAKASEATPVNVSPGQVASGIDAQLVAAPPVPTFDISVDDVTVESSALGPFVVPERVSVTVSNSPLSEGPSLVRHLRVDICPASGERYCNRLYFEYLPQLNPGESHTEIIEWNALGDDAGSIGDMTVTAWVPPGSFDTDAANNEASTETSVLLPPTGVGVNVEQ